MKKDILFRVLLALAAVLAFAFAHPAKATLVIVDNFLGPQSTTSTTSPTSDTKTDVQVTGLADFIGSRTLLANNTSGTGNMTTSVGGGFITFSRDIKTVGTGELDYTLDKSVKLNEVFVKLESDLAFGASSTLDVLINDVLIWHYVMSTYTADIDIMIAETTLADGSKIAFRSTGPNAVDILGTGFGINQIENNVPEPSTFALAALALFGISKAHLAKRTMEVKQRNSRLMAHMA